MSRRALSFGVLLIAAATMLLEVSLTRVFAVTLWYHFAFLTISVAMLGAAAAAVCCYVGRGFWLGPRFQTNLAGCAAAFGLLAPLSLFVHLNVGLEHVDIGGERFYLALAGQIVLLFATFFCAGMCISLALSKFSESVGRVYCYDLLGAAAGGWLVFWLLPWFGAPALAFAVSAAAFAAAFLFLGSPARMARLTTAGLGIVSLAMLFLNDRFDTLSVTRIKRQNMPRIQKLEPPKLLEEWSAVGRIAVYHPEPGETGESMKVSNDGAAPTVLRAWDGDFKKLAFLRHDSRQIGHHLKQRAETLILGSAGGTDVLAALLFEQPRITAVELNPVTAKLVTEVYADYIGNVFQHPRVDFHCAEGRQFVARCQRDFDLIQITMIDSWAGASSGAYVFNESTLYTVEAVREYWRRLRPQGVVSITRYLGGDEALRLTSVMLEALDQEGVRDAAGKLAAVTEKGHLKRTTVLLKKGDFTAEELARLYAAAAAGEDTVVYAPSQAPPAGDLAAAAAKFHALIVPRDHGFASRGEFLAQYPTDISASTDDRPFFFFTSRLSDVVTANESSGKIRRMALPLLYGSSATLLVIALLTTWLPLKLCRRKASNEAARRPPQGRALMLYFALLGVGFMLIELALIHRLTLFLGYPALAFVVVITTLLASAGLGSSLGTRGAGFSAGRRAAIALGLACVLGAILAGGGIAWLERWLWLPDAARIALCAALLAPLGFLMGMGFPLGICMARQRSEDLVPWAWGVNGAFSVFGTTISLVLALNFGLQATLLTGVACYAACALAALRLGRPTSQLTADADNASHVELPLPAPRTTPKVKPPLEAVPPLAARTAS